jgi:hypothetical protein
MRFPFLAVVVLLAGTAAASGYVASGPEGAQSVRPGDRVDLTIRWILEDGYYLDDKTKSSLTFSPPRGISMTPSKLQTSGRIIGMSEQAAVIRVAKSVAPGSHRVTVAAEIYFCSLREQWCKRVTRKLDLRIDVSTSAAEGRKALELELPVPLDDER